MKKPVKTLNLDIYLITIDDDRQRSEMGEIDELAQSIQQNGLLNPIIVDEHNRLICGERRLSACKSLGHTKIEARLFSDLSQDDQMVIEFEENIRRKQLTWQEEVAAIKAIHDLLCASDPEWNKKKTSDKIGRSVRDISRALQIHDEIQKGNSKVIEAPTKRAAANVAERARQRDISDTIAKLNENQVDQSISEVGIVSPNTFKDAGEEEPLDEADQYVSPVENADFIQWSKIYSGQKFNMLHCDFPYGIDHGNSDQGGAKVHGAYDDSKEIYWQLCQALVDNIDRILLPSAHMIFWFSMNYYQETINFFRFKSDLRLATNHPLIWVKSDNRGIVADVERRPRHIYETALLFSRGDRKIIEPVADVYSARTVKDHHISEKPQQMLEHFFRMCVDGLSLVLDPTCGSGSALRAAAARGAERVHGLELNPEYADIACNKYRRELSLAKAAKLIKEEDDVV